MNRFLKWLIAAAALLFTGALIIVLCFAGKKRNPGGEGDQVTKTVTIGKEDLERVRDLEMNWDAGKLTAEAWDRDYLEAKIVYRDKGPEPSIAAEGRDLIIENSVSFWNGWSFSFGWFSDPVVSVELFMPESLKFEQADICCNAGDICFAFPVYAERAYVTVNAGAAVFDGLYAENLVETELGAGTLTVDRMSGKEADIHVSAGEIKLLELTTDIARVKMSAGRGKIAGTVSDVNLELSAGKLEFTNTLELSDVWMEFDISAGTIELNNRSVKNHGRTALNEGCRDTGKRLAANVSAGTLKLQYKGDWSGKIRDPHEPTELETQPEK